MTIKVGINGFGRIGRLAFREIDNYPDLEVVAVNDQTDAKTLAHLLKYDSAYGRYPEAVEVNAADTAFLIGDREVQVFSEKDPLNIPWGDCGVDIVIEATGKFKDFQGAGKHIQAGADKVIVSAPGSDDMKMIVFGVNDDILEADDQIVSTASCTTNCLAPMAASLDEAYGIVSGLMTTVHAYTGDQNLQDAPHSKLTRARAAAHSIVPTSTGAAKAIGKVIPSLEGKLDGSAQRVPVLTGSLTELTVVLEKETTVEDINALMQSKADDSFAYTEDPIVSADIVGERVGSLFDATQTKVMDTPGVHLVKVAAWYDNEMGYVSQMIRTLEKMMTLERS